MSANNARHGDPIGLPVHFATDALMHPNASLTINLNNTESIVDASNGNDTVIPSAPLNLTSPSENDRNPQEEEISAKEAQHDPNDAIVKPENPNYDDHTSRKASLTIDLNNRKSHADIVDTGKGNDTSISSAPLNLTHSTNVERNANDNEITAVEVWHDPNGAIEFVKPYFANEIPNYDGHTSPKVALQNVLKRFKSPTPSIRE